MRGVVVPSVPIYAIADADSLGLEPLPGVVGDLAAAGAEWIQLRIKQASDRRRWQTLEACVRRLEGSTAGLWIDDRVDLATLLPCVGVHLGQRDLPSAAARPLVSEQKWIGRSCHDLTQVEAAAKDSEVDVVAIGPIYSTRSKADADPKVGLEVLRQARRLTDKPLVAIGGIGRHQLSDVLATGVDQVAVIGALGRDAARVAGEFRLLLRACEEV